MLLVSEPVPSVPVRLAMARERLPVLVRGAVLFLAKTARTVESLRCSPASARFRVTPESPSLNAVPQGFRRRALGPVRLVVAGPVEVWHLLLTGPR